MLILCSKPWQSRKLNARPMWTMLDSVHIKSMYFRSSTSSTPNNEKGGFPSKILKLCLI